MHQKITGQIDSLYTAQSHSIETLRDWHSKNSHVSKLVLSSQVIFPIFACGFLILYFYYLIESDPVNLGEEINSKTDSNSPKYIQTAERSKVWIMVTISFLFTIGNIIADGFALMEYAQLPKEIESYINDKSIAFAHLHGVPVTMMIFDIFSFLLFIIFPVIVACYKYKNYNFQFSDLIYMLLSPLVCIATHSYHVIFAFINNPYHATSVLLRYIMILFLVVVILQKIFYLVLIKCFGKTKCACGFVVFFYIVAIVAIAVCIGLIVVVLIVLPLNNPIDQASNEIYVIYQASVTVFAALVTFQVFFREENSIHAVLIKAADNYKFQNPHPSDDTNEWKTMPKKKKEQYLGKIFLDYIGFQLPKAREQRLLDANDFPEKNSLSNFLIKVADHQFSSSNEWKRKTPEQKEAHIGKFILKHIGFQTSETQ